jgi:integrase
VRIIHFPNWPEVLTASRLPGRVKHSYQITIRWYLGFCRRGRAEVHVQSARDFIAWAQVFVGTDDLRSRGEADIAAFLDHLALNQRLSASSQRQALNALVFLFREVFKRELGDFSEYRRAQVRPHLPVWLSREELQRLFEFLHPDSRLMAQVMYGAGLRLMELLRLRVKDVDLEQEIITVRGGKGEKDRFAPLAHSLVQPLSEHVRSVQKVYDADRPQGVAGVWLPDSLERKYPNAGKEWPWFWLWPDAGLTQDPRAGLWCRHHAQERTFQVAVKIAAQQAGLNKRVTPLRIVSPTARTLLRCAA